MPAENLKARMNSQGVLLRVAGAHNALGAALIQSAGFDAVWASSLEVATSCGQPDDDAVIACHVLPAAASMASTTRLPVIVDAGTGGGTPEQAAELVRKCETADVAAVSLEDVACPKRNSLLPGPHRLASAAVFAQKINVAKSAQQNPDFVVIARVEALIARAGLGEALSRARQYVSAGADAILIHSKSDTADEVLAFIDAWDSPIPLVLIPTTYYTLTAGEMLNKQKVKMAIYANQAIRASIRAVNETLRQILDDGTTRRVENRIATLSEVFDLQAEFARLAAVNNPG